MADTRTLSTAQGMLVPSERIAHSILLLRGQKVLLDADLAELYGVPTKVLVQAVKRNLERFPDDFMFQLTNQEFNVLRSQIVTSSSPALETLRWGGRRSAPYAFTEQGVAMLSSVLSSPQAIAVNIEVMRAFVRLREVLTGNKELATKLGELERKLKGHDQAIAGILDAIRQLMAPPSAPRKRPIGFVTGEEKK
ncbi:MAG: ORF6N domain-containing protein [Rhodocyclaceae bacterium]|nr:ORF6N domain-containing protein [Rhodocyclaceae bacterium]